MFSCGKNSLSELLANTKNNETCHFLARWHTKLLPASHSPAKKKLMDNNSAQAPILSSSPLSPLHLIKALYWLCSVIHIGNVSLCTQGIFFRLFSLPAFDYWLVNCLGPQRSLDHQLMYLKGICLFWKCKCGLPQRLTGKKWPTEWGKRFPVWSPVPPSITPRPLAVRTT